jgi:acyl-CoA synthetase (AMP-forming)/AMP-acid ligase II
VSLDFNIADRLAEQAVAHPALAAVADARTPNVPAWTFAELDQRVDHLAAGLAARGFESGQRALVFVTPSMDFFAAIWALFRVGVAPVLIDPAMGPQPVLRAIEEAGPEHMLGIPKALLLSRVFGRRFRRLRTRVGTTGLASRLLGATPLAEVYRRGASAPSARRGGDPDRLAAILFTSGSTGAPKGVLYTHGIFDGQRKALGGALDIRPGETDLSAFPLFSLFSQALGAQAVVPDMDTTKPAAASPERVHAALRRYGVTYAFGSPAFWRRVVEGSTDPLPLRRLLMAGAPAAPALLKSLLDRMPEGSDIFTPYGATESLPITMPSARALLDGPAQRTAQGAGTWVGHPLPGVELRVVPIDDGPIAGWEDTSVLPPGEVGELVVRSAVTTQGYFRRPEDDAASKIPDAGRCWHRMGDVGYLDDDGLWFCGRKKHRVQTASGVLFPVRGEAVLNRHPAVVRTAIVGVGAPGAERPVIFAELEGGRRPRKEERARLTRELLELAAEAEHARGAETVLFHRGFPVDARHNAKIRREVLKVEAERELAG